MSPTSSRSSAPGRGPRPSAWPPSRASWTPPPSAESSGRSPPALVYIPAAPKMVRSDDAPLALRAYRDHIAKSAHQEATVHHHPTILGPVVEDRRRDIAAEARRTRPI